MQRETIPIPAADSQGDTAARNFWRTDYSSRNWAKQQGYTLWRRIQQEDDFMKTKKIPVVILDIESKRSQSYQYAEDAGGDDTGLSLIDFAIIPLKKKKKKKDKRYYYIFNNICKWREAPLFC